MSIKQECLQIRKQLTESIKGDIKSLSSELVIDLLKALSSLQLTAEIVKDTKIGSTVSAVSKKFTITQTAENGGEEIVETAEYKEIVSRSRELMIEWKKVIEGAKSNGDNIKAASSSSAYSASSQSSQPSSSSTSPNNTILRIQQVKQPRSSTSSSSSSSSALSQTQQDALNEMGDARRKIFQLFFDAMKLDSDTSARVAEMIGFSIEEAINNSSPFERDSKQYNTKVRSLLFNLKKNKSLRTDLTNGSLHPSLLVTLSAADLATDELRQARQQESNLDKESRRSDWIEENKQAIREAIGCVRAPEDEWVYSDGDESDCFEGFD